MAEIRRWFGNAMIIARADSSDEFTWVPTSEYRKLEAQLERATDLIRYQRIELLDAELINEEEYAALATDGDNRQRVARLEGYDGIHKQLAEVKKAAENLVDAMETCHTCKGI